MDEALRSLLSRLDHLSDKFRELREGVHRAIDIADVDPEMALTRARKVLEYVIRDVYERRINEPPGTRPLENLLQRLVKDGHFPDRLDAYAATIRKLGNVGTHSFGETVAVSDVFQSLAQLMPILEWYFEVERPEALDGQDIKPRIARPVEIKLTESTRASSSHIAVVPKGLRSFDANDAAFFLDLLSGPRDKDGLPESIRFWQHRIEAIDEPAFTVGVIYGLSGCGKSSLVKAGLLPRLSKRVLAVSVEATAADTEARLLNTLRRRCPNLPSDISLAATIAALRQGTVLAKGQKVLIVLDQLEQWLHAHRNEQGTELAQALRQCDGQHVQCIALVRDDFWVALSRFMADVEIELAQGQNMALVDLFDLIHARNVLAAFGRAFGRLSDSISKDQNAFLDQAVRGLAQDGWVIALRLALFAEMVKGKPWTPSTLKKAGGAEGVGITFLEETFSVATAPPEHRYHQTAARAVLKALLPESGSDIKGRMQSKSDLFKASGCASRTKDFDNLIRILDSELRLISPIDPEGEVASDESQRTGDKEQAARGKDAVPHRALPTTLHDPRFYQLTHDYLVPSIRDWLTRKQKETRRGRAELLLADRAAVWNARPENRQLPSLRQWLAIRWLTRKKNWTPKQTKMMRRTGRVYALRSTFAALVLLVLIAGGREILGRIKAKALVEQLESANIAEVPEIVKRLDGYRRWADPLLKEEYATAGKDSQAKLYTSLALLPIDSGQVDYLRERLLAAGPTDLPVIRDILVAHRAALAQRLWKVLTDSREGPERRFRAACALATYDSSGGAEAGAWRNVAQFVAEQLLVGVQKNPSHYAPFLEMLLPVREKLLGPLEKAYRNRERPESERSFAASILVDYAFDKPLILADLLMDADEKQFAVIYPKFKEHGEQGLPLLTAEIDTKLPSDVPSSDERRETLAKRQANAAVALLRMNQPDKVWPLLEHSPDPRVRSYLINWLGPRGADPRVIIKRLDAEPVVSIRRALVLSLGEYSKQELPATARQDLLPKLQAIYRTEADPGLHAAVEWLVRQWSEETWLKRVNEEWARDKDQRDKASRVASAAGAKPQWYVNSQAQTMVVIPGPVEFMMGSPESEKDRRSDERPHRRRISRVFAITAKPVTLEQYRGLTKNAYKVDEKYMREPGLPVIGIDWYQAAEYCNLLSKSEEIPDDQWCYEKDAMGQIAKLKANYLSLKGYRLPTETELEYATRSGTVSSRYYGETEELLGNYAWYAKNSNDLICPMGTKKPNDLGLFDSLGNVYTWCQEEFGDYPGGKGDAAIEDEEHELKVDPSGNRVLRGSSFDNPAPRVRSAVRADAASTYRYHLIGFRVAKTLPPGPLMPVRMNSAENSARK